MADSDLVYFDIAATVVTGVSLISFLVRRKTRTPANRVYLSILTLILLTASVGLMADVYDIVVANLASGSTPATSHPALARGLMQLLYYALRSLAAPAYLLLIATVSDTKHLLNNSNVTRMALWGPMLCVLGLILTNPIHHLVFFCQDDSVVHGPAITAPYIVSAYYSLIGIGWLFRWKKVLTDDEFATLMMLYPLVLLAAFVQFNFPHLHIEMFITSVGIMLVSAFVMRPERQMDSLVSATSLTAYRDLCHRAFVTGKPLCLVYLEIVNIERLRELIGKDELQNLVRRVSDNLTRFLEPGDVLFYLRGGLFCISPANLNVDHALAIAHAAHEEGKARAQKMMPGPATMGMRAAVVSIPENIADEQTLSTFVRRLSHLIPESRVASYEELARDRDFELNMALGTCIENAIRNRSFEVYYQPIYSLHDGKFHSAEALVRLNDPTFGPISPGLFIPAAEQSGAIIQIGDILLEKICRYLAEVDYAACGLEYVEVNLSLEQCIRPQMAIELLDLMRIHGVNPARMNLELTESSSSFSQEIIERNVYALSSAGVTFSLDDYGCGYSNLNRALTLPFDIVKFDKSFVDALDSPTHATAFARSISMMREIGKKVLVEGVETSEQARILKEMGADYIQGYYYARPIPQADLTTFLYDHNVPADRIACL